MADVKTHIMNVIITPVPSKTTVKIHYTLEWGKGAGERKASGIYTYAKPKNQIERDYNKEALAVLETKRSRMVLDLQSVGSGHIRSIKSRLTSWTFMSSTLQTIKWREDLDLMMLETSLSLEERERRLNK